MRLNFHSDIDHYLFVEGGEGEIIIGSEHGDETRKRLNKGHMVYVPARCWFKVINQGEGEIMLNSIYARNKR